MIVYVLNQFGNHWLLFNGLQFAITMCLKLGEEIRDPFAPVNLIGDDFSTTFEFVLRFTSNIRKEVCGILDYFFYSQRKYEKKNSQHVFYGTP